MDGSTVQQFKLGDYPSERWRVISRGNGQYSLENENATKSRGVSVVLDGRANSVPGARAVIYQYGSSYAEQKWYFEATGSSMVFRLSPVINPVNVLCVQNGSSVIRAPVEMADYKITFSNPNYSNADQWVFEKAGTIKNYGEAVARGEVAAGNDLNFFFSVPTTAEYVIETAQPNSPHGVVRDTVLTLYDEYGQIVKRDDDGGVDRYSRIVETLSPGNYKVSLTEIGGKTDSVAAYIAIFKSGELIGYTKEAGISDYANLCYDFIKIGDFDPRYNCLAYALGYTDRWIDPKGPLSKTTAYMESQGYTKVNAPTDNCVVAYGTTDAVGHFARLENGVVKAKLGPYELMRHSSQRAYFAQSIYGPPIAYYIKNN